MNENDIKRRPRHIGHKIALVVAGFGVFGALCMVGITIWCWLTLGPGNTWTPSALAGVGFFACIAWVCQAMSVPQPDLSATESKL